MRSINLLPEPTWAEKYRWLFSIIVALILTSISMYWLLPYFNQAWHVNTFSPPSAPTHSPTEPSCTHCSIYKLKMVGYLSQGEQAPPEESWSVVQSPDGQVFPVKIGDYLGYEAAKVTDINPTAIYLEVPHKTEPVLICLTTPTRE